MSAYMFRRERWWDKLRALDDSTTISEDIRADMLLQESGLTKTQKLLVMTSINNNFSWRAVADALRQQHPLIHEEERSSRQRGQDDEHRRGYGRGRGGGGYRQEAEARTASRQALVSQAASQKQHGTGHGLHGARCAYVPHGAIRATRCYPTSDHALPCAKLCAMQLVVPNS